MFVKNAYGGGVVYKIIFLLFCSLELNAACSDHPSINDALDCFISINEEERRTLENFTNIAGLSNDGGIVDFDFAPNAQEIRWENINISGGTTNINSFNSSKEPIETKFISNRLDAHMIMSNGSFNSTWVVNNQSQSKIEVTGGIFESYRIDNGSDDVNNNSIIDIKGGSFKVTTDIANKGEISINGGNSTIQTILNEKNLNISGGVNNIGSITNSGIVNITNGDNTISNITNNGMLEINGGVFNSSNLTNNQDVIIGSNVNISSITNNGEITTNANISGGDIINSGKITGIGNIVLSSSNNNSIFQNNGDLNSFSGNITTDSFFNGRNLDFKGKIIANEFVNNANLTIQEVDAKTFTNNANLTILNSANFKAIDFLNNSNMTSSGNISVGSFFNSGESTILDGIFSIVSDFSINNGKLNLKGGTFSLSADFTNNGQMELDSGSFSASNNTLINRNIINLQGSSINVSILENNAIFNVNGGSISSTNINNNGNFNINANAIINGIFNNSGNLLINHDIELDSISNDKLVILNKNLKVNSLVNNDRIISNANTTLESNTLNNTKDIISNQNTLTIKSNTFNNSGNLIANGGNIEFSGTLIHSGNLSVSKNNHISIEHLNWGSGKISHLSNNNGVIKLGNISNITNASSIYLDFSDDVIQVGKDYYIFETINLIPDLQTNMDRIIIEDSLFIKDGFLSFDKQYADNYFTVKPVFNNQVNNLNLESILSNEALNILRNEKSLSMLNELKNINTNRTLQAIISNPKNVSDELNRANRRISNVSSQNLENHIALSHNLSILNRLNKVSTPILNNQFKLDSMLDSTSLDALELSTANTKSSESANSNQLNVRDNRKSNHYTSNSSYSHQIDYNNNIYASLFGIFGSFGNEKINSFGISSGYDNKITSNAIIGGSFSYGATNSTFNAHNISFGAYSRAYFGNSEIDAQVNFSIGFNDYERSFLNETLIANYISFGVNLNTTYGYLLNLYKNHFIKPLIGLNIYYGIVPKYSERGEFASSIENRNSAGISLDLGFEYRLVLNQSFYFYALPKIEQFILNQSNDLNVSFIGGNQNFQIAQSSGLKNYIWLLLGGEFEILEDTLNLNINFGFKNTILASEVNTESLRETYLISTLGVKYYF